MFVGSFLIRLCGFAGQVEALQTRFETFHWTGIAAPSCSSTECVVHGLCSVLVRVLTAPPRVDSGPDPLMVGIRSPDELVVGLAPATLEFWVRFPNERNQGKRGATLCLSTGFLTGPSTRGLLPLWRGAGAGGLLADTRRWPAAEDGVPPSMQITPHTHILTDRSPALYSPTTPRRAHSPTTFPGPMARPPPSPAHAPCSHPQTGPPDSATSPVIVLCSCALCARLCMLALPPSLQVVGFGFQLPPRLCIHAHTH